MAVSRFLVFCLLFLSTAASPSAAQRTTPVVDPAELLKSVVKITTTVPSDARTARGLGTSREGSGVVIDSSGLILTIGYLILEAETVDVGLHDGSTVAAETIAYDHDSGFGLLRATKKLDIKPASLGRSSIVEVRDRVLAVSHGGQDMTVPAMVVSRRPFAGSWEYLLESAIYTAPAHPVFGGAALFSDKGELLGIGSLIVNNAIAPDAHLPGNMFVPVDILKPVLADLLDKGRSQLPLRPWLGIYADEINGRLFVSRTAQGGPASKAGIEQGDLLVGVGGKPVTGLADFYRKVWATGIAGTAVQVNVLRGVSVQPVEVKSIDRYQWLRSRRSY